MSWIIGVDVGGTFTDFHAVESETGTTKLHKTPSTPDNPAKAILQGLRDLSAAADIPVDQVERLAHGTTVATNTLIQRKGAEAAVLTTDGFKDLLEIGRQIRPKMFDLKADHPPPLAPRHLRFEVAERMNAKGEPITELSDDEITRVVQLIGEAGVETVAICFLFAFLNPVHEQKVGAALREAYPDLSISLSSDVQPEFREYERFSTTLLNAYLQPVIGHYIRFLGTELGLLAPAARIGINQSSGGLMSVDRASEVPIRTALSGPAAGAIGAAYVAKLAQSPNVITLDMGGTSADVALIEDYRTGISFDRDVAGFPVRLPMVDINTVGAGGGSIAWFDKAGILKVGPLSAGAKPGPACYGQGGTEPTVSDANLVLGRLSTNLLSGAMSLDLEKARAALAPIADKLEMSIERTAHGILGIVVANMVRAVRTISIERGYDPRAFTLMPFGGAGALHAGDVARALGMSEILVPLSPGILCAQGLVVSDLKENFVTSTKLSLDGDGLKMIEQAILGLQNRAERWFEDEAIASADRQIALSLDLRYRRQNFEIPVVASDPNSGALAPLDLLRRRFFEAHERTYGHYTEDDPIEVVNIRLDAFRAADQPNAGAPSDTPKGGPEPFRRQAVWFEPDRASDSPVFDRAALVPGHIFEGPAIIEQLDATIVIHPGDKVRVDQNLNLIVEVAS